MAADTFGKVPTSHFPLGSRWPIETGTRNGSRDLCGLADLYVDPPRSARQDERMLRDVLGRPGTSPRWSRRPGGIAGSL